MKAVKKVGADRAPAGAGGATQGTAADPARSCDCAASRQLTAVLETAADAIVRIDERGTVCAFNRAAERMFGYDRGEVVGRNVNMLMPDPHRGRHDTYLKRYLTTGEARIIGIGRESVGRRKDGAVFPIDLAVSEVVEDQGRRTFTGVVRDVSDRRRLEAEILEVSEREQQRIGHELHDGLCQEIAGIAFAVQSLQRTAATGGAVDPDELNRVTVLLQDAVRHARGLSHGLYPVDPQPLGLSVALAQLAADTSDVLKIRCEYQSDGPVSVRPGTTATHLYRIAQEAVREAVRHGSANHVVMRLSASGGSVALSVTDDGISLLADGRYKHGMVLRMMRHRARVIGGSLQIGPGPRGAGVRVVCEIRDSLEN